MYERKERNKNSYYPAFFCMDLDIPDAIGNMLRMPIDERTEALFLHEYIHYLQDITTVSGYARIETIVDQIKWAVMLGKQHHKLTIPLNPKSTWAFNMTPNATCLDLSRGDFKKQYRGADVIYNAPESFDIVEHSTPFKDGRNNRVKIITRFTFKDVNDVVHQYDIGEMAISESMAYIIEQHVYPGMLPAAPDFPYNLVRNVVRWKCQRAETDEILVAICDVCLMYSFPGYAFYYLIEWLHQYQGSVTPALIYLFGLGPEMTKWSNTKYWGESLKEVNAIARKSVDDYFIHRYWRKTADEIGLSLVEALNYRLRRPAFFIDILRGGKIHLNRALQEAVSYMGCMAIYTDTDDVYHFPVRGVGNNQADPDWFVSLHDFYKVLFTREAIKEMRDMRFFTYPCALKEWCKKSFKKQQLPDLTSMSRNCDESPWLHVSKDELAQCSFGRLWATYGFNRVKIKV